jgi:ABC-2 type transport system permease protein
LIVRYLRLLRLFFRTELQYELEYRFNILLEILQTVVVTATSVAAVLVLFNYTTVLNGWDLGAMLILLGCFYLVQGFGELVLQPSFEKFMEHVRLGTLDFALLKPASAQFLVTLRHFQVVQLAQMGLGAIVIAAGLPRIASVGAFEAVGFVVALACGFMLIYALLLALSTFAFWFVRVDNLMALYWSFMDAGRFPVDMYPGWLRVTLSSAVPIGVAVTVPAQVIAGRLDAGGLGLLVVGTVAAFFLASWFWRLGLRSYTGASA